MKVDRIGAFRGLVLEHAVSTTTNGYPQWVAKLQAAEMYNEASGEWEPWTQYNMDITAYMVLFGSNGKPCMNFEQVRTATAWDGTSFASLDQLDLSGVQVLFRVEEGTYEGVTRLQVNWVDTADASPIRTLKKLDSDKLKALDGKFKLAAVPKPASAPKPPAAKPPAAPKAPAPNAPKRDTDPLTPGSAGGADATGPSAATAKDAGATPSSRPTPPAAPPRRKKKSKKTDALTPGLPAECTKLEAWEKVAELKTDECTDDQMSDAWCAACETIGKPDEDDFTPGDWMTVRNKTLDAIPSLPF